MNKKCIYIICFFILLIFIIGCNKETISQPSTDISDDIVEDKEIIQNETEEKIEQLPEKLMIRGTVDPDFVVEKYDINKTMDGTTFFTDNHNSDKPRIIEVNMIGEIIWEYDLPQELKRYTNPGFDAELLPNDNILFLLPGSGIYEINRNKNIVWSYKNQKVSHDADRLPNGNTLFVFGNEDKITDSQVTEIDPSGKIVWSWKAGDHFNTQEYNTIYANGWTHTNAVLRMSNSDTLVSPRNFNMLIQVNSEGDVVKTIGEELMTKQHDPVFLSNGNLLFANHAEPNKIIEIDPSGKIIWEFVINSQKMQPVRDANRLSNGNTLITGTTKIIEVTPNKEIVWSLAIKDTSLFTKETSASLGFYKAERIIK